MKKITTVVLLAFSILLTGCHIEKEKIKEPIEEKTNNEEGYDCEDKYSYNNYSYNDYSYDMEYQEPHTVFEFNLGKELDIAFLYTYFYPVTEESIEKGFIITNQGEVFNYESKTLPCFEHIKNLQLEELTLKKTIEENIMNEYLTMLDDVDICNIVNVDNGPSYTEAIKKQISIYGVRDEKQIKLFESGDVIKTPTDENALAIVEWIQNLISSGFQ